MRLSLPATASRLMSAIVASFAAGLPLPSLPLHALGRMESGVAPVFLFRRPVGCHPGGPAQLAEMAETDGLDGAWRNGEFGIPIELSAGIEIDEIRERLAQITAGQKPDILRERLGEDPDPDLVLDAVDAAAEHGVLAEHRVALAQDR